MNKTKRITRFILVGGQLFGLGFVLLIRFGPAAAGPENNPPPAGMDSERSLLYRFTGVTDDGEQGSAARSEATTVHCTNAGATSTEVEVQLWQWNGTEVYTATAVLAPNRTITFSSQNTEIYFEDVFIGGEGGTGEIFQGSGQIFSNHREIICTAQALDPLNKRPQFMVRLPLFDRHGFPVGMTRESYLPLVSRVE